MTIFYCLSDDRQAKVSQLPPSKDMNGIDYLEVIDHPAQPMQDRQRFLRLHFINPLSGEVKKALSVPDAAASHVRIEGGVRIRQITALKLLVEDDDRSMQVELNRRGDFSIYRLRLVRGEHDDRPPDGLDPLLAALDFSFKVGCPSDFDCKAPAPGLPPDATPRPVIDYLAKDFNGFRQVMLDRLSLLVPDWSERNPADLGITLVELLAYAGDYLSYKQDAIATEAYLGTARRRVSVRRHARLVDYFMHDGCNARAWLQVCPNTTPGEPPVLLTKGTQVFTRLPKTPARLGKHTPAEREARLQRPEIFETCHDIALYPEHNAMFFYTWGYAEYYLPRGSTSATLKGAFANLKAGDVLVLVEMRRPGSPDAVSGDPTHRQAVRLTHLSIDKDPLFDDQPVTAIYWGEADALGFDLVVAPAYNPLDADLETVPSALALGNIVLVDHGETHPAELLGLPSGRFRPVLQKAPLVCARPYSPVTSLPYQAQFGVALDAGSLPAGLRPTIKAGGVREDARLTILGKRPEWSVSDGTHTFRLHITEKRLEVNELYSPVHLPYQNQFGIYLDTGLLNDTICKNVIETAKIIDYVHLTIKGKKPVWSLSDSDRAYRLRVINKSPDVQLLEIQKVFPLATPISLSYQAQFGTDLDAGLLPDPLKHAIDKGNRWDSTPIIKRNAPEWSLEVGSLAYRLHVTESKLDIEGPFPPASQVLIGDPAQALPAIRLTSLEDGHNEEWLPRRDLLNSPDSANDFVVEIESGAPAGEGQATLRFGDDRYGRLPPHAASFSAVYRTGGGPTGNVGEGSLRHIVSDDSAIGSVWNPLPAAGGLAPETIEYVRQMAPYAFRRQERAVTPPDYAAFAGRHPEVQRAAASFRWTGSWYTVYLTVDRRGGREVGAAFKAELRSFLEPYRMAGHDLEIEAAIFVPLEVVLETCIHPDYFKDHVVTEMLSLLNKGVLPDGRRGFFHPDNFTFGQPVYLSQLIATARSVPGVEAVDATTFQRKDRPGPEARLAGQLTFNRLEIACLDNDRNFPERGSLKILPRGGK